MTKLPTELSEDTQLTLNIKTIAIIIAGVVALAMGYFTLKNDIKSASEKSEEALTKIEFNISQDAVKQIVRETQEHIRGGHTTMYQMLVKDFREEVIDAKKEIIQEIRR
jgi:hypothetical protein|tara:strand:- start:213 stop:539 length:327 start_codon:yes stop_codon:yes gene_type:complete